MQWRLCSQATAKCASEQTQSCRGLNRFTRFIECSAWSFVLRARDWRLKFIMNGTPGRHMTGIVSGRSLERCDCCNSLLNEALSDYPAYREQPPELRSVEPVVARAGMHGAWACLRGHSANLSRAIRPRPWAAAGHEARRKVATMAHQDSPKVCPAGRNYLWAWSCAHLAVALSLKYYHLQHLHRKLENSGVSAGLRALA